MGYGLGRGGAINSQRGGSFAKGYDTGQAAYEVVGGVATLGIGGGPVGMRASAGLIARNLNGGRSRVEIVSKAGKKSYDLIGKAHFEKSIGKYVRTPHKFFQPVEPRATHGYGGRSPTKSMNWIDIVKVLLYLRR